MRLLDIHLDIYPPDLQQILMQIEAEKFLEHPAQDVKGGSQNVLESRAIESLHSSLNQTLLLHEHYQKMQEGSDADMAIAARMLEQLQISAADAERAAYICHLRHAVRASQLSQKLAQYGRNLFHDMKEMSLRKNRKKAA